MDDMRAMMQNELRQTLAGLVLPTATIPPVAILIPAANLPVVEDPPANNDNIGGNL